MTREITEVSVSPAAWEKLFCSILNSTTRRTCHVFKYTSQISNCFFLPNKRTADHVFTLRALIDKYVHNHKEKIYACFVDLKKAFDSVWLVGLLHKLWQINVGPCFYNLIKSFYFNSTCAVKIAQKQTRPFRYARGLKEGCILSLMLFNFYINDLPSACDNTLSGPFVLPNGTKLNSLFYADDLIILSRFKTGLQNLP